METVPCSPAAERNRQPILEALGPYLANARSVLEIGSGTGQHAVHFAASLPHLSWQASDLAAQLPGLRAQFALHALSNLMEPIEFDAGSGLPLQECFDGIYTANTLHIMAWTEVEALFSTLPRMSRAGTLLAIYGPFNDAGRFTSPSNAAFDLELRRTAAHRGLRDIQSVDALAVEAGFEPLALHTMPANNLLRIWKRIG